MHSRIVRWTLVWTASLLLALICIGWLPLLSAIGKSNSTTNRSEIILGGTEYNSTSSTEPTIVMRGSRQLGSSIDIRLRFSIKEFSQYENVFQTADRDDGIRLEIFSTPEKTIRSAIIYSKNGAVHVFQVNKDLDLNKTYLLTLRTEKAGFVSVYLNSEHLGYFWDELIVFSDFLLGRGYDSVRTFTGHVALEYGRIILASPMEKTLAWIERVKILPYIGYVFLLISVLAFMKIGEFVFYENEELLCEYPGWKRFEKMSSIARKIKNSKYCAGIATRLGSNADVYFLILFKLQIIISFYAVAKYSWGIGNLINDSSRSIWGYSLYEWTKIFYNPFGGNIFNYFILCIFAGLYGLVIYVFINKKNIELIENASNNGKYSLIYLFIISLILLAKTSLSKHDPALRLILVALFPFLYAFALKYKEILIEWWSLLTPKILFQKIAHAESYPHKRKAIQVKEILSISYAFALKRKKILIEWWSFLTLKTFYQRITNDKSYPNNSKAILIKAILFMSLILNKRSLIFLTFILLFIVSFEPMNIIKGPVYLLNEYDIPNETYIDGVMVNNEVFLNNLQKNNPESSNAISEAETISRGNLQMEPTRNITMSTLFSNRLNTRYVLPVKNEKSMTNMTNKPVISSKTIKEFYLNNYNEYLYYNISRGQINHIGHVLNPINEYQLGKPIRDIYMQYGLGYTFLLKWTMELFGGTSIENYYKCYIYYVVYFIFYLIMVFVLFRSSLFAAISFAVLCYAYYLQEFIPLILAPGINPAIHLFDVFVVLFLVYYFRKSNLLYLVLAVLSALAGIVMNKQFGSILTVAVIVSIFLYLQENAEKKERRRGFLITGLTIVLAALVSCLTATGTLGETLPYFLTGLFSFPASRKIINLTLIYISCSYLFFFTLKDCRHYLKYVYVMVSIYTQGLFVYFYWSGLSNHLPTVIPFLGLQLLLMIFIAQNILFNDRERLRKLISAALHVALAVLLVFIVQYSVTFYRQKAFFINNFVIHTAYNWNLEKAKIVTTINPKPIMESISLIQRYSPNDKGIFILSKYDNLLPFLANRYSKMTFFEMTWHLVSERESKKAIATILAAKPELIFIDSNLPDGMYDPWSKLFYGWWDPERNSRLGRYRELQKVIESVSFGYSLVEKGTLISVYQRNLRMGTSNQE